MNRNFRILILAAVILSMLTGTGLVAQDTSGMVKYTPDFRFKDGIYVNFEQVKLNNPIPKARLLTSTDYNDKEFFRKLFESDKLYYYDGMGVRQEIPVSSIWGYARNGVLYIQVQNNFNRITFVGSICHFVADITTVDNRYYSPYGGYYDPYYYSPYNYGYGSYYSPYGSYYSPYSRGSMTRNELKQYLIDFEEGKIIEFDQKNTELLLMKDAELYEEYVKLSRKERKNLMFVYIRKFNERNPLYIPVNQN
ncbi:MAG: hypothetical protein JXR66_04015 [Bacteroidales bacterium]|nr:hypothetical protein [Bacteroidales bacterium]MBN2632698.1 hypothetical protein [Bacteroidales bacterium]